MPKYYSSLGTLRTNVAIWPDTKQQWIQHWIHSRDSLVWRPGYGLYERVVRSSIHSRSKSRFSTAARLTLGLTEHPIKWVLKVISREIRRPDSEVINLPSSSAELKNAWRYSSALPYVLAPLYRTIKIIVINIQIFITVKLMDMQKWNFGH
jgi:hypothetical protein